MKTSIVNKTIIVISLLALLSTPNNLFAQINVPDIKGIKDFDFSIACELTIVQGDNASIEITGDEDELSEIYFKTFGDELLIKTHKKHQHKEDIKVTLVVPNINELSLSGIVDVKTPNTLNFSNFSIEVSGVANIDLKIKSQKFQLDASGVLKGDVTGETTALNLDISGMVDLDASGLVSTNCEVDISGMGSAEVNVIENLDASVSGMGKIAYTGHPRVHANTSGIGRIKRL